MLQQFNRLCLLREKRQSWFQFLRGLLSNSFQGRALLGRQASRLPCETYNALVGREQARTPAVPEKRALEMNVATKVKLLRLKTDRSNFATHIPNPLVPTNPFRWVDRPVDLGGA